MRKGEAKIFAAITALLMLFTASPISAKSVERSAAKEHSSYVRQTKAQYDKEHLSSIDLPTLKVGTHGLQSLKKSRPYQQATPITPMRVTSADGSNIYGTMIYNSTWTDDSQPAGFYKFKYNDGSSLESVFVSDDYVALGGAVYANNKVYFISYMSIMGYVIAELEVCDFDTWDIEESIPVEIGSIARDMTYDPTTGNVYGCFYNDDGDGWVFGRMSLETGDRYVITDLDTVFLVIAANSKGEIYGIDLFGDLYKFDKFTGARTKIGNTGYKPEYSASGCFDLRTDKLYWECLGKDEVARIFEVNTEDASVTLSTTLPNSAEIVSMFIPTPEADDAAPAAVSNLKANFDKDSFEGNVTFTLPNQTFSGETISDALQYEITLNEVSYTTGTGNPGEEITAPISVTSAGEYRIAVYASNSVGRSPVTKLEHWIGYDIPDNVHNLTMKRGDANNQVVLSWDPVAKTVHGGYIDPEAITYKVVRMPDNVTVASDLKETGYTDTLPETDDLVTYSYRVSAINGGMEGEVVESDSYSYGVTALPFSEDFNDEEVGISRFFVVDADNDGYTWTYDGINQAARVRYSSANSYTEPKDDWLFTPMFSLKNDRLYYISFKSRCYDTPNPERIEVKMGNNQSVDAMTQQVFGIQAITSPEYKTFGKYISVPTDGHYSIGFHACSAADKLYLYVDDILVEEGPLLGTPDGVSSLTATAGENGSYEATISFKAPTQTVEGSELGKLSKIEVFRGDTLIKTFDNPAVGSELSYTDTEAVQGNNIYYVTAYNEIGAGHSQSVTVFVGYDVPDEVSNVKAHEVDGGKVVITWDAPTKGKNGGYFDPNALTYLVWNGYTLNEIASDVTELTATDENPDLQGEKQTFIAYYVFPKSPGGYGIGILSNILPIGEPFAMPFKESFANAAISEYPWEVDMPEESGAAWYLESEGSSPDVAPQDNDGGMVSFLPSESGDIATLYSSKIDFSHVSSPVLEFYYYVPEDCFDYLRVGVSADSGDYETVKTISYRTETETGWQKASIDLSKYASAKFIALSFEAESYNGEYNLHFDKFVVKSLFADNLEMTSLTVPDKLTVGEAAKASATITNAGINSASDYSVSLLVNGDVIATKDGGATLKSGDSATFEFKFTPTVHFGRDAEICARVSYDEDMDEVDNRSETYTIPVKQPRYPGVYDLEANVEDNNVLLTWGEPESQASNGQAVTDGAENYKPFIITNIGDWTMVDCDKQRTIGIYNEDGSGKTLEYDNIFDAKSFMVFNPSAAGLQEGSLSIEMFGPHSGDQMFMAFDAENGKTDDWMISPELPGTSQEISFFVKSVTEFMDLEKYEVLYSSTGYDVADFVKLGDTREAPATWTEVKVVLPEGAKYFAIRCVSEGIWAFMVDDIKYLPASAFDPELSLLGYNVYCNKVKLNDSPVEDLSYIDTLPESGYNTYYVTVVYDLGESPISNIVTAGNSGVKNVNLSGVSVHADHQNIIIKNAEGKHVAVFAADGKYIAGGNVATETQVISTPVSGIYIVMVGNEAYRVITK
jgi:hypothetical protein